MVYLNLLILVASVGCMGGCALVDKLCLEIFFGFIFIATTVRMVCGRREE